MHTDLLARIRDAHDTDRTARAALDQAVADARAAGVTWQQIADTLGGVSRQAVQERFGGRRRPARPRG